MRPTYFALSGVSYSISRLDKVTSSNEINNYTAAFPVCVKPSPIQIDSYPPMRLTYCSLSGAPFRCSFRIHCGGLLLTSPNCLIFAFPDNVEKLSDNKPSSQEEPNTNIKEASDNVPENAPEPVPENAPEPVPENVPEPIPESVPEPVSESVPEPVSESVQGGAETEPSAPGQSEALGSGAGKTEQDGSTLETEAREVTSHDDDGPDRDKSSKDVPQKRLSAEEISSRGSRGSLGRTTPTGKQLKKTRSKQGSDGKSLESSTTSVDKRRKSATAETLPGTEKHPKENEVGANKGTGGSEKVQPAMDISEIKAEGNKIQKTSSANELLEGKTSGTKVGKSESNPKMETTERSGKKSQEKKERDSPQKTEKESLEKVEKRAGAGSFMASLNPTSSLETMDTKEETEEEGAASETIVWEWEQELDEYDEPDIYPSEKDYVMVPTLVEITEEDDEDYVSEKPAEGEATVREPDQGVEVAEGQRATPAADSHTISPMEQDVTAPDMAGDDATPNDVETQEETIKEKVSEAEEILKEKEGIDVESTSKEIVGGKAETPVEVEEGKKEEQKEESVHEESKKALLEDGEKTEEIKETGVVEAKNQGGAEEKDVSEGALPEDNESTDRQKSVEGKEVQSTTQEKAESEQTPDMEIASKDGEQEAKIESEQKSESEWTGKETDVKPEDKTEDGAEVEAQDEAVKERETEPGEDMPSGEVVKASESTEKGKESKEVGEMAASEQEGPVESQEQGTDVKEEDKEVKEEDKKEAEEDAKSEKEDDGKHEEEKKEGLSKKLNRRKSTLKAEKTQDPDAASVETEDVNEQADEFEVPGLQESEPEAAELQPKRYKTVMVRTLVPRPPKIHYVPEEERKTHVTNDKHLFRKRPISLVMSYGYDCQRMANLHVLDKETLVFMSGFVLTFFNHITKEQTYLRCIGGSCFGALAIHPSRRLFAAAEKGEKPVVGIWSWPKLQLFRKLREGTNKVYASVNFSPCGRFLATQGGEPDYLITVYNWLAEMPVVRVKSHAQDVYRVTFSKELAGRLTTAGLCHIKFWKMATTFTGLKLKGDIGRFGRTELSDIEGYIEMPDGKVLSGSEWGNLLLWENGLIVAEICVKPEIPCHEGIVRQVVQVEGEFYTAGQDGWVRTWPFDTVDAAEINTTEESLKVSVKSSGSVLIKEGADIWFIVPDIPDESTNSVFWFAQDGKGCIMRADLSFLNTAKEPYPVLTSHGGPIVSCATSRLNCIMATLGQDGQIRVYDYLEHTLLASRTFSAPGTVLLWPGTQFDETCCTILAGFADGTFRSVVLSGRGENGLPMSLILEAVRKPHSRRLTCFDIDNNSHYLATGGEDGTVFFFDVTYDYLPLLFVSMPDHKAVVSIKWARQDCKDLSDEETPVKLIAALAEGTLVEFLLPKVADFDNTVSYFYTDTVFLRRLDFLSIKSELLHNEEMELERLAEERLNAAVEVENRKLIDDGHETESQQNLRLLEEAEELERIKAEQGPQKKWEAYIPPEKSPIMFMIPSFIDHDEVFLSMGGYDTGYLYLMRFGEAGKSSGLMENPKEPVGSTKVEDSKDKAVTAYTVSNEGDYIFLGFADGRIRVQNVEFPYALEHIDKHWTEGIHDCVRGQVTSICLDKDGVFLFTTGSDGNCFMLSRMTDKDLDAYMRREKLHPVAVVEARADITDLVDPNAYTLEVYKKVEKEMALLAEAKKNKAAKREEIARLRIWYHDVLRKNNELPEEIRLSHVELALFTDREARRREEFETSLKQLKLETAWHTEKATIAMEKLKKFFKDDIAYELFELRAFNSCANVWSFRLAHFPPWFEDAKEKVETHITPYSVDSDTVPEEMSPTLSEISSLEKKPTREPGMDKFVYQRMVRIWERKQRKRARAREWKDFLKTEPKSKELKEEDRAIEEARANLGDMKLKSAADYKVPESKKLTEHRARKRLVRLEERMYNYKKEFNESMLRLRQDKIDRLKRMAEYRDKIYEYQKKLSEEDITPMPEIKQMVISENPNMTMNFTAADVREYKRQIEEKLKAAAPAAKVIKKQEGPGVKRKAPGHQKMQGGATKSTDRMSDISLAVPEKKTSLASYLEPVPVVLTTLEERIQRTEIIKAKFWQDHYSGKIEDEKMCFDARLRLLRHRKLKLDFLLKTADARMVLLTQEYILAQQSEALEASLETKIHDAFKEKRECNAVIKTLSKKLDNIKKEMEFCTKQKNALISEVVALAQSRAPAFEKYLLRVFNKRMPKARVRPSQPVSQGSNMDLDSEDEESSESSDDDIDLSDDEDDGLDIDFPPPELNQEVYDRYGLIH